MTAFPVIKTICSIYFNLLISMISPRRLNEDQIEMRRSIYKLSTLFMNNMTAVKSTYCSSLFLSEFYENDSPIYLDPTGTATVLTQTSLFSQFTGSIHC